MIAASLGRLMDRLTCRLFGHRPSELEAVVYGTEHAICRRCLREVDE